MEQYDFYVEDQSVNERLDVFITGELENLTRSAVQKLILSGCVFVNHTVVKSNYKLKKNDIIMVTLPDPEPADICAEDIPLNILYEDEALIVIDKPKNMVVHPAPGHYSGTLVNALMFHCKDSLSGINGEVRPGIVHRIDKDTSGILVVAKTDDAHICLSRQLMNHSMKRVYNALVFNNIKQDQGVVDKPIGRSPYDRKKMGITEKGRHAVTHYTVVERFGKYTHIKVRLETGRTHQIRVHMASIGHPLLGDCVYGNSKQPFNLEGQALHAGVLGFVHPVTGNYMEFCLPLPTYFEKLLLLMRG